jgi:hypothetical protein
LVPQDYDSYLKNLFGENYKVEEPLIDERKKSHILGKGGSIQND